MGRLGRPGESGLAADRDRSRVTANRPLLVLAAGLTGPVAAAGARCWVRRALVAPKRRSVEVLSFGRIRIEAAKHGPPWRGTRRGSQTAPPVFDLVADAAKAAEHGAWDCPPGLEPRVLPAFRRIEAASLKPVGRLRLARGLGWSLTS